MPRISADTVAEHVARQEAAVIAAAAEVFAERGYAAVSLGDIAARVGLARNSIYRYFPTKAHILEAWFDGAMTPLLAASASALADPGSPADRLAAWVQVQLETLLDPANRAMTEAAINATDLPDDVRATIGARHAELYAPLRDLLVEIGVGPDDAETRALLIAGLMRSGNDLLRRGATRPAAVAAITRAAQAVAGIDPVLH